MKNKILKFWTFDFAGSKSKDLVIKKSQDVDSIGEPKFMAAECCNPIPGDNITGYKDPRTGDIIVHKTDCQELIALAAQKGENLVGNIKWSTYKAESYLSEIKIRGIDRVGILQDLAQVITVELDINIRELHIQSHDGIFEGKISLYVPDTESLHSLIHKVNAIKGIDKVERV